METKEKNYIDLMSQIPCDTMLNIKYSNNGKISWCKYYIPMIRKNNTAVLYGELYHYFINKEGFLFALGYIAFDDLDQRFYLANRQYFGFTKYEPPHINIKSLDYNLVLPRSPPGKR